MYISVGPVITMVVSVLIFRQRPPCFFSHPSHSLLPRPYAPFGSLIAPADTDVGGVVRRHPRVALGLTRLLSAPPPCDRIRPVLSTILNPPPSPGRPPLDPPPLLEILGSHLPGAAPFVSDLLSARGGDLAGVRVRVGHPTGSWRRRGTRCIWTGRTYGTRVAMRCGR